MNIYKLKRLIKSIIPNSLLDHRNNKKNNKLKKEKENIKLIMCLLCKDEADILEAWFIFHKSLGVDGFIVTDNNSKDKTLEILKKYKEKGWILELIEEKETNFYQDSFCDRMIKLAKNKYKADYIISADADEFWYPKSLNLKIDILKNKDCNIQRIEAKNYYPDKDRFDLKSRHYFISNPLNDINLQVFGIDSPIFRPFISKVIFKSKDYKSIIGGNHNAIVRNRKECYSSTITIYHFYIRNYKHFISKINNGGKAMINIKNINKNNFWLNLYENYYLPNKMNEAWNFLFLPDKIDLLKKKGIISIDNTISEYLTYYSKND